MRASLSLLALCLGAWITAAHTDSAPAHKRIPLKVIGPGRDFAGQFWGQTYFPPMMSFRLRAGNPPASGITTLCEVITEKRTTSGHSYSVISLRCEEGLEMELEAIDLQGGGQ
jgi:hypothetical protein